MASKPLSISSALTITPTRQPINHTLIMPLRKLIFFLGSGLGHVGQIVEAGLVDLQAFFSQIKTREETNVSEGQASVRLCLKTAARLNAIFDFSPSVQR